MAAITAGGTNVTASVVNSTEVQVSFTPNSNGSFRVVIASPVWTGGNAATTASTLIGSDATTAASTLLATQSSWWNSYWANAGLIEATSSDGTAAYMENLRTLYLYDEAASMHSGDYPGSQAGVADMFAYDQDQQDWYPAGYWLWNLRGQIAANMSSGNFSSNLPIFSMYLDDLPAIESWTSAQMGGKAGACVPETMRFNGNGYYNGGSNSSNASCAMASSPSYNALNIASGPEIAMDIWQQYQDTGSLSFLQQYFPVMEQAVTFLLAYQSVGSDGFLHAVANAHESQWAVQDPTDDIAADQALFPAVISAATLLNTDSSLVSQLRTAENQIEPYARVSQSNLSSLLNSQPTSASAAASADAGGSDVIGDSYQPSATIRNSENIGLEPVWPYGVIGDSTTVNGDNLTALADRTYNSRPNTDSNDWSYDAVDAARLDMGSQVSVRSRRQHREVPDLHLRPGRVQSRFERRAVHRAGFQRRHRDGRGAGDRLRRNPAHRPGLAVGLERLRHRLHPGRLQGRRAGRGRRHRHRRHPGGHDRDHDRPQPLARPAGRGRQRVQRRRGGRRDHQRHAQRPGHGRLLLPDRAAVVAHHLAARSRRSPAPRRPPPSTSGARFRSASTRPPATPAWPPPSTTSGSPRTATPRQATTTAAGPASPQTALTNAGAAPGATVISSGIAFTFPNVAAGSSDNTVAEGQTITMSGSGTLGFLVSGSYGPASGTGTITYTDGSTQSYTLNAPDWFSTSPPSGGAVAVSSAYQNRQGNTTYAGTGDIFSETVTLTAGKTIASVTLPPGGALTSGTPAVHVFAISAEGPYGGTAAAVPGTVQAANYDTGGQGTGYNVASVNGSANSYRPDGVDLEACSDTGCGDDIGWTGTGQWFRYTVNVATARTYTVTLRLSSPSGVTDALHIASSSGANLSGAVSAPNTGGWQTYATATVSVALPAGKQTLTIYQDNGGWNIHDLTLS